MKAAASKLLVFSLLLLAIILSGCAKIGAPPGGPVDKIGPHVVATIPADNTINAARSDRITIQFSENVEKKSARTAVFITPRFTSEPKHRWKGKTLHIMLPDSFAENTTYVVTVGSETSDLRKNKMDSSHVFAFSTGPKISRGRITGMTMQDSRVAAGVTLGLYEFPSPDSSIVFDSVYPPYITQSGKDGTYSVEYLPDGTYFLLAYGDNNKDQRFNRASEPYGVPDRFIAIQDQATLVNINFTLISEDTGTVSILSVALAENSMIRMKLDRMVPAEAIQNQLEKILLIPADSTVVAKNPIAVREKGKERHSTFHLHFTALFGGEYHLRIAREVFGGVDGIADFIESRPFTVADEPDTNPPRVEAVSHADRIVFAADSIVTVRFSEPIDRRAVSDSVVLVFDDFENRYDLYYRWSDPLSLEVHLIAPRAARTYSFLLDQALLVDLAGNQAGDSVLLYTFRTYDPDSLGIVSGTVMHGEAVDTSGIAYLSFSAVGEEKSFSRSVAGKSFDFSLPPGNYLLYGFQDRNLNGIQDFGSLLPYLRAETWAIYPDTVRIRSRFETAGIDFHFE
ncbi:MAG: Ig-like domain-containing protein [Candidatus Zixiibacteriota bacterium]|nr:MAG: Ig-like domain-containing protein [candidate division Zixibacteria bacterium]